MDPPNIKLITLVVLCGTAAAGGCPACEAEPLSRICTTDLDCYNSTRCDVESGACVEVPDAGPTDGTQSDGVAPPTGETQPDGDSPAADDPPPANDSPPADDPPPANDTPPSAAPPSAGGVHHVCITGFKNNSGFQWSAALAGTVEGTLSGWENNLQCDVGGSSTFCFTINSNTAVLRFSIALWSPPPQNVCDLDGGAATTWSCVGDGATGAHLTLPFAVAVDDVNRDDLPVSAFDHNAGGCSALWDGRALYGGQP